MPRYPSDTNEITKIASATLYCQPLYLMDLTLHLSNHGKKTKQRTAETRAIKPSNESGMDLKIA